MYPEVSGISRFSRRFRQRLNKFPYILATLPSKSADDLSRATCEGGSEMNPTQHSSQFWKTQLFETLQSSDFSESVFRKKPFALPKAAPELRKQLGLDRIVGILQTGHANCWLPLNGQLPPNANGRLTAEDAMSGFTSGRTVLIRHSEQADRFIQSLAERFAHDYNADVDIQLFGTPASHVGFGWHYDIEEVFIVQASGVKTYNVRANLQPGPYTSVYVPKDFNDFLLRAAAEEQEVTLAAGDLLYLPAGTWHTARAVTDSWHFSIGLTLHGA